VDKIDLSRFSLEGRTAIITGGSGGIGSACASAFAKARRQRCDCVPSPGFDSPCGTGSGGARSGGSRIDGRRFECRASKIHGRPDSCKVWPCGHPDHVAGGSYSRNPYVPSFKRAPLLDLAPEDFMIAYEINTKSAFLCAKSVFPAMKACGKGSIINIGSISGRATKKERADMAAYGSAKAAVMNLTLHMAHQWGPEIRVNCIAPGIIDTPRPQGTTRQELSSEAVKRIALGRAGRADEVASVALFLASDAASFVSGAIVDVNGGE
jgi:NAD(P)-dependent dehydrogenase (short-subunit alcohol dehydrogenase family)